MNTFNLEDHPHRRYNPLTGAWIQVSPHRAKRPWQGQEEDIATEKKTEYDEKCYLCPTNTRAGSDTNPDYKDTYSFVNDFSALLPDIPDGKIEDGGLFRAEAEKGICKVVCFSPRHDLTIADMKIEAIVKVVDLWQKEYKELGSKDFINHVQIFENKGSAMGASNPHPHGQIWAENTVPDEPAKESIKQKEYFEKHGKSLLANYLQEEINKAERIVIENDDFAALVPFWAVWPYETIIISKRHFGDISQMTEKEKRSFAEIYKALTSKYDKLFNVSFPYSAGIHQSPTDGNTNEWWHFHMHFYPPLLRSATVKKFMVGYEMLGNPQRDITPETSARILKEL
ncbi:MAG: UDP-glucose--hexose-1-phosphate uridylyltransferase [Bacteroidota bacterium]